MSLNFYGTINSISIDNKDNVVIKIKTGTDVLGKKLVELNELKQQIDVSILLESAELSYTEQADIETNQSRYDYHQDENGVWQRAEVEQTALNIDGQNNYQDKQVVISAKDVDHFLLTQNVDYPEFDVRKVLAEVSEGYEFDEIAKNMSMTTIAMLNELNKARDKFAPYAYAWKQQEASKDMD